MIRNIFRNPRTIVIAAVAALLGCGLALSAELWWESSNPTIIHVSIIDVDPLPDNNGHTLTVHATGPPAKNCLRFTQHLLFYDEENQHLSVELTEANRLDKPVRHYAPLGMAMNGLGFTSVPVFSATLFVPPNVPSGRWVYQARSAYLCTVFPGFVQITPSVSPPVEVDLP